MKLDDTFLDSLLSQAENNSRLRQNYDMRSSSEEQSQRMLNALLPGTEVAIHRHPMSSENVILLQGKIEEILFNSEGNEIERVLLCPTEGQYGITIPAGTWHTINVLEPSVIFEFKAGKYGEDGSEMFSK